MDIINDALPWSSDDEYRWNAFLQTDTGKKLLPKLLERVPQLLGGGQANEILIRSGEVRGFQLSVTSLLELTHSPPAPSKESYGAYPPLNDDSQWNDGQTTVNT